MTHPPQLQTFAETGENAGRAASGATSGDAATPASCAEAILAIWRDILGRSDITVSDDFFTLGDHSLAPRVVARIRKTLGVDIPVMDFFESRTATALAALVAARSAATRSSSERHAISRRPADAEPVLSFDQQRLWMEHQLLPGVIYNVHARRRLIGSLDVATLEASVRIIVDRHEALRTRFVLVDGRPTVVVDEPGGSWGIRVEDVTDADDRASAAFALLDDEAVTPFDLAAGPLLRCLLIKVTDTEYLFGVTMHHIVSDTWSIALFVRELSALYQSAADPDLAELPALPVQYQDYAIWQRGRLVGAALEKQLSYWRGHLAGAPPVLALPTAQRRTTSQRAEADRIESTLSEAETAALHRLCRAHGITPFMALLASLATVFARWSGQEDVVIGIPLAGRTVSGTDNLIGFFVNVLPFRIDLSGAPTFAELLGRVRRVAMDGYDHADAPLDALVEDLQVARDPRRTPLFEVVLNVVGSPESEQVTGLVVEPLDTPSLFSRFDLSVTAQETAGRLKLHFDFASDRCDTAMVSVLVGQLRTLLSEATQDPAIGIFDYPVESAEEAAASAAASAALPEPPHAIVDKRARDRDTIAVIDSRGQWGYRWLSLVADRVAQVLAEHTIGPADEVGIVHRAAAGFVAIVLGCMKAGVSFSVIESAGQASTRDAGPRWLLDVTPASPVADGTIDLSALLAEANAEPGDPLPLARQDGSPPAGPGGDWAVSRFGLGSDDRFAVLSTGRNHLISALHSVFGAGAALVMHEPSLVSDVAGLTSWLQANAISVVYATPPIVRAIAAQSPCPQLQDLTCVFIDNAGDFVPQDVDTVHTLSARCRCVGLYRVGADGQPAAAYEAPADWPLRTAPVRVPLGSELPGRPVHVLRPSGQRAATGEVGEICLGSHHTGDIGRRWPDGSLEFIGTIPVNLLVDPVETMVTLRDLPDVRDAFVVEQPGKAALAGYVVGPDPQADTVGMHSYLRARLPSYLIPAQIFVLDALPLTPSGEYDLTALPIADADRSAVAYVAPRTPMERQLTELLKELLGIEQVGVYDSFFELGGFSLLATQLTTRIRALFDVELALRDVFEAPTVDELAQLIVRTQGELSGTDELEALLDEIEQDGIGVDDLDLAVGSAPADQTHALGRAVARLRDSAAFAADKPDETPETTAQALWYAAAGAPCAVGASSGLPLPVLSRAQEDVFDSLLGRRIAGEPLAYLTGRGSFMELEFRTEPGALIPRRETELLGAAALSLASQIATTSSTVRILDLCTGSGNLAVSLAVLEPRARVWASDLEGEAVAVARRNAEFHHVTDRVTLVQGDLFAALDRLSPAPGPFDLVVCNPPYMPSNRARSLPVAVGGFEPTAAFDGGDVGLDVLYRLIDEAPRHLVEGGWVCFELGAGMGRVVELRLAAQRRYDEIRKVADWDGTTRAILARRLP